MIRIIAEREFLNNLYSYKSIIAFVLCAVLFLTSFFVMTEDYEKRLENYAINQAAQKKSLFQGKTADYRDEEGRGGPVNTRGVGKPAEIKRPRTLSLLAKGLSDELEHSLSVDFGWWTMIRIVRGSSEETNRLFSLFVPPDFVYVVKIVMSFLALLFTFDAISGEKQDGTLKLSLSVGLSRSKILLGKLLGGYLSLLFPFLIAFLSGTLFLSTRSSIQLSGSDWISIGLIVLFSLIYILVFLLMGLLISSRTSQPSTSLVVSLLAWIVFTIAIPNLGLLVAKHRVPLPSYQETEMEKFRLAREIEDKQEKVRRSDVSAFGYGSIHSEIAPKIWRAKYKVDAFLLNKKAKLFALSQNLTRLSPTASYTYAATELAGTGVSDLLKMERDVLRQYNQYIGAVESMLPAEPTPGDMENLEQDKLENAMKFNPTKVSLADRLRNATLDGLMLCIFCVLLFVGAYASLMRYDVR